jgi:hypothetical protein
MSHQKKHTLPPHNRRRQKSAEETLANDSGLKGGAETLDAKKDTVKRAPLWTGDHGMTKKP